MSVEEWRSTILCRCEDLSLEEIEKAVDEGCTSLLELKRRFRVGMGPCQGRFCLTLLALLISRKTGQPINEMDFPRARPPIRPIPLRILQQAEKRRASEGKSR